SLAKLTGAFTPPISTETELTVDERGEPGAGAPAGTDGLTAPNPAHRITMVSPALTGFEESARTADAAYTNPWPIPDLSFVKIAGCAGAVFTGSGSVGTVPFCTKSCWL